MPMLDFLSATLKIAFRFYLMTICEYNLSCSNDLKSFNLSAFSFSLSFNHEQLIYCKLYQYQSAKALFQLLEKSLKSIENTWLGMDLYMIWMNCISVLEFLLKYKQWALALVARVLQTKINISLISISPSPFTHDWIFTIMLVSCSHLVILLFYDRNILFFDQGIYFCLSTVHFLLEI